MNVLFRCQWKERNKSWILRRWKLRWDPVETLHLVTRGRCRPEQTTEDDPSLRRHKGCSKITPTIRGRGRFSSSDESNTVEEIVWEYTELMKDQMKTRMTLLLKSLENIWKLMFKRMILTVAIELHRSQHRLQLETPTKSFVDELSEAKKRKLCPGTPLTRTTFLPRVTSHRTFKVCRLLSYT